MIVMKSDEFIRRLKDIATNKNTFYILGCFGAPMNDKTVNVIPITTTLIVHVRA